VTTNVESTRGALVCAWSGALGPGDAVVADVMRTVERVHEDARVESIRFVGDAVDSYVRQQAADLAAVGL